MFPTLRLGPLSLQASGLILIVALWLGLILAERFAIKRDYPADKLYNLVLISLIAGFIGARVIFVLGNLSAFTGNLSGIVSINPSLLDPIGGIASAIIAGIIYGQRKKLPLWQTMDGLTPLFAVMLIGIGFSHLATGNAYGVKTGVAWGIELWGEKRHPSQVYEIITGFITLVIVLYENGRISPAGTLFLKFVAVTSGWLLFLEGFRGDSKIFFSGIRATQIIALLFLCIAFIGLEKRHAQNPKP